MLQLVKVGVCAFGMSGKVFHAPFLKEHPAFFMSAIVERSGEESKMNYPDTTIFRSVAEMVEQADISLVVVNTPVQTHFAYAKIALEAGKNVIVEKPFTVNVAEAEELVRLAEEKNVFLSVYQNRRFDRDFLQVKKIIEEGKLGTLKEVEIRFDRFRPQPGTKIHKENPDLPGSGTLHDLGAHLIDQATQLFGFPEKIFADIFSMKGKAFANDYFELILYYKDELRVRLKSSVFSKEAHHAYILHGTNGSFLQQRSDTQEEELVSGTIPVFNEVWTESPAAPDGILNYMKNAAESARMLTKSEAGDYMHYYDDIYEHIVFGKNLPSPGSEIIQNMKLIEAAVTSAKEGKVVDLIEEN